MTRDAITYGLLGMGVALAGYIVAPLFINMMGDACIAFVRHANRWRLALDLMRMRKDRWVSYVSPRDSPCPSCTGKGSIHFIVADNRRLTRAEVEIAYDLIKKLEPTCLIDVEAITTTQQHGLCFAPKWIDEGVHATIVIHPDAGAALH